MITKKQKMINLFVDKFINSINLPNWNKFTIIDVDNIRFSDEYIISFSKDTSTRYKLKTEDVVQIKKRISYIEHTDLYKKNKSDYEKFEEKRKTLGVSDLIIKKVFSDGYDLNFYDLKDKENSRMRRFRSEDKFKKVLVSYIENGRVDINNISFSISLNKMYSQGF